MLEFEYILPMCLSKPITVALSARLERAILWGIGHAGMIDFLHNMIHATFYTYWEKNYYNARISFCLINNIARKILISGETL